MCWLHKLIFSKNCQLDSAQNGSIVLPFVLIPKTIELVHYLKRYDAVKDQQNHFSLQAKRVPNQSLSQSISVKVTATNISPRIGLCKRRQLEHHFVIHSTVSCSEPTYLWVFQASLAEPIRTIPGCWHLPNNSCHTHAQRDMHEHEPEQQTCRQAARFSDIGTADVLCRHYTICTP